MLSLYYQSSEINKSLNSKIHGISLFHCPATAASLSYLQLHAVHLGLSPSSPDPNWMQRNSHFSALILVALEISFDTYVKPHILVLIPLGLLPGLLFLHLPCKAWPQRLCPGSSSPTNYAVTLGRSQTPKLYLSTVACALLSKVYYTLGLSCLLSSRPTNYQLGIFPPLQYPGKHLQFSEGLKQASLPNSHKTPASPLVITISATLHQKPKVLPSFILTMQSGWQQTLLAPPSKNICCDIQASPFSSG